MDFNFKTQPYQHQLTALEDSWAAPHYALLMEMGTGKTKVALDTMVRLYEERRITAALVIAPKGVYDNWIKLEIPTHVPTEIAPLILRWQPNISKKYEDEVSRFLFRPDRGVLKIFVMNVEAFSTPKGVKIANTFCKRNPDNMVIVDESTTIKNRKARRTKNIVSLNKVSKYRRILTGSPITKSPMDLFSQCLFLDKNALGFENYFAFQARYSILARRTINNRSFQEITGYRRLDELTEKLEHFSNRVLKKDCLDLPDKIYMRRDVDLTDEQVKLYRQMQKLALAKLQNGELATTQSVLTQIMRLQQICCGFLQPDEGELQPIPSKRMSALREIVDEADGKAIIWATYRHDIAKITEMLQKEFGPRSVASYFGDTPQDERQDIVNRFQDPTSDLRFFVAQPKTGGYGITLTEASTVVYYSNSYDLEIRLQSEDRAHRIGQQRAVTYIDLVSPNTIDEKILKALRSKINIASEVLNEDTMSWLN
jgi:SNF2 family DNA or RNA helicase